MQNADLSRVCEGTGMQNADLSRVSEGTGMQNKKNHVFVNTRSHQKYSEFRIPNSAFKTSLDHAWFPWKRRRAQLSAYAAAAGFGVAKTRRTVKNHSPRLPAPHTALLLARHACAIVRRSLCAFYAVLELAAGGGVCGGVAPGKTLRCGAQFLARSSMGAGEKAGKKVGRTACLYADGTRHFTLQPLPEISENRRRNGVNGRFPFPKRPFFPKNRHNGGPCGTMGH